MGVERETEPRPLGLMPGFADGLSEGSRVANNGTLEPTAGAGVKTVAG